MANPADALTGAAWAPQTRKRSREPNRFGAVDPEHLAGHGELKGGDAVGDDHRHRVSLG